MLKDWLQIVIHLHETFTLSEAEAQSAHIETTTVSAAAKL